MRAGERAFLNVERSLGGRFWRSALDERAEAQALRMAQHHGLPDVVARVLAARGVESDAAAAFLDPSIKALMPDPSTMTDMDAAAARIADAVDAREKVAVFGDYDVDGAASAALIHRYLGHFGMEPAIRIPDRITEGYGPNPAAMRELAAAGAGLILTVDCGISSIAAIEAANAAGAEVVVLDHHQAGPTLPPALAAVDPNRQDDLSGLGYLAAAGVVFMTLVAVSRELRRRGRALSDLPDILQLLDLVALATVCDVVPLTGLNRAFVVKGLQVMRSQRNAGLRALAAAARLGGPAEVYHLGYILGPRINAGGRIGEAHLGSRLLCSDDDTDVAELAEQLSALNEERQAMERAMLAEADAEIACELAGGEGPTILVAASDGWHPGIVGLLAARLKERHGRPAFAIAFDAAGKGAGSGRSIGGFDLGALVRKAVEANVLEKGGGHAMAAGITIRRQRLGDFRAFLETEGAQLAARLREGGSLKVDGAISARGLTQTLMETLRRAGPYGSGHAEPVFVLPRHRIQSAAVVGQGHVRATLKAGDGATVSAVAFRAEGNDIGRRLLARGEGPVHAAGSLSLDRYGGRETVQLRLMDLAEAFD